MLCRATMTGIVPDGEHGNGVPSHVCECGKSGLFIELLSPIEGYEVAKERCLVAVESILQIPPSVRPVFPVSYTHLTLPTIA